MLLQQRLMPIPYGGLVVVTLKPSLASSSNGYPERTYGYHAVTDQCKGYMTGKGHYECGIHPYPFFQEV